MKQEKSLSFKMIAITCIVALLITNYTTAFAEHKTNKINIGNPNITEPFVALKASGNLGEQALAVPKQEFSISVSSSENKRILPSNEEISSDIENNTFSPDLMGTSITIENVEYEDSETDQGDIRISSSIPDGWRVLFQDQYGNTIQGTYQNGNLSLFGTGVIEYSPLHDYADSIRSISVAGSITIGVAAFYEMYNLTSVGIAEGSSYIGEGAFWGCTSLSSVSIPSSVKRIDRIAFFNCTGLTGVSIPAVTRIEEGAFYNCYSLKNADITGNIEYIGNHAFANCHSLERVVTPSVKEFGNGVFLDCIALKEYVMPSTLTKTGTNLFDGCSSLSSVTISEGLEYISDYCFFYCGGLRSVVIPNNIKAIGNCAFYNCENLKNITFPSSYIDVGAYAFSFCNNAEPADGTVKLKNVGAEAFFGTKIIRNIEFYSGEIQIGTAAFHSNKMLTTVNFNNSIVSAGDHAFYDCPAFDTITNAPTFSAVEKMAFGQCRAIKSVTLTSDCTALGYGCFEACSELVSVDCSDAPVDIGDGAFYQCTSLDNVKISKNCRKIGVGGFYDCANLTAVNFSDAAASLGKCAFRGCAKLTDISNVGKITSIGVFAFFNTAIKDASGFSDINELGLGAFAGCRSLKRAYVPAGLTEIPEYLFVGCASLETAVIPESVTAIKERAFGECDSLESVTIPDSVTVLENEAFGQCDRLTEVSGGGNVTEIGDRAFSFCDSLRRTEFSYRLNKIGYAAFYDCKNLLSAGDISGAVSIGDYCFTGCSILSNISINNKIERIGDSAFNGCEGLKVVNISDTIEYLGKYAFENCTSLETVNIGNGIKVFESELFAGCTKLKNIEIPSTVTEIKDNVFWGCTSLESVTISQNTKSIGDGAFYNCIKLKNIHLPKGINKIGRSCFYGCSELETAVLPDNLEDINSGLFYECKRIKEIIMPENVRSIGMAAFDGCEDLETVALNDSLKSIGEYAFMGCKDLKEIAIPSSVRSIGEGAFSYCSSLEDVHVPNQIVEINNYLFYGCTALNEVKLQGNVAVIGTGAFYDCAALTNVCFAGGTPAIIGDKAFYNTNSDMKLYNTAIDPSWTTPTWNAPDGNTYNTAVIEADINGECGDNVLWKYYSLSGTLVIYGNGRMDDYTNEGDRPWYIYTNEITSVHINDGVTHVGDRAFANCTMLRSVYMNDSVEDCGAYSFAKCENLAYIELPGNLNSISDYMLYGCKGLTEVNLPIGIGRIGRYAFFGCESIATISLPDSVEAIGEGAFYNCSGMERVALPSGVDEICDHTFNGCNGLRSVIISDSVKRIGKYAFNNCNMLEWACIIGSEVSIDNNAFSNATNLKNIYFLHSEPKNIGYRSFYNTDTDMRIRYSDSEQWSHSSLIAADGSEIICTVNTDFATGKCGSGIKWSFYEDTGILDIYGNGAMYDFEENDAPWRSYIDSIKYIITETGITSIGANAFIHGKSVEKAILANTILSIGTSAFADCDALKCIDLPDGLEHIGENAFYNCSGLTSISVPDKVNELKAYTFGLCKSLHSVKVGTGLNTIGYAAFYACDKMRHISLPNSVTNISAWSFARCAKLEHVDINNVTALGEYAFFGCESLADQAMPSKLTAIPDYAFAGTAITTLNIPNSVKSIGERAFWYCSDLTDVSLGAVKEIGEGAFYETQIKDIDIPKDTTDIGSYAFASCEDLETINVASNNAHFDSENGVLLDKEKQTVLQYPIGKDEDEYIASAGISRIAEGAFYNSSVKSVVLPETVEYVDDAAFAFCDQLGTLKIASGDTDISSGAFYGCTLMSTVYFGDSAPKEIGEDAFAETSKDLTFIYEEGADGWTEHTWTGPDGNKYKTAVDKPESTAMLVTGKDYDETNGGVRYYLKIKDGSGIGRNAVIYVVAYENKRLKGVGMQNFETDGFTDFETSFGVSGGVRSGKTEFRVFLWDRASMQPITDDLYIPCEYDFGGNAATILTLASVCEAEPIVDPDYSAGGIGLMSETEEGSKEILHINMDFGNYGINELINESSGNAVAGFDVDINASYGENTVTKHYTTNIDMSEFDSSNGYTPCGVGISDQGYAQPISDRRRAWMPLSYPDYRLSSEGKFLADTDASEVTGLTADAAGAYTNGVAFKNDDSQLFSVRGMGFSGMEESAVRKLNGGEYAFTIPYAGVNLLYTVCAENLITSANKLRIKEGLSGEGPEMPETIVVSMTERDKYDTPRTLCELQIETEDSGTKVKNVTLTKSASFEGVSKDRKYEPTEYSESIEASENMTAAVNSVTPDKGSNGRVTVKYEGLLIEANAEPYISKGNKVYKASDVYYYGHDKLYATFDLVNVPDGEYEVGVIQNGERIVCNNSFTVDSSLPKGTLTSSINVDKTAQAGVENNGSVTFTNTGYTDVYSPVILIDCGNVEFKDIDGDEYTNQKSAFAYNAEGLPGVIANGETAAYNFTYKVLGSNGFIMNVYNYADITENISDEKKLTAESDSSDIINYNMYKLTGIRACDFAEKIAEMASLQGSLGEDFFGLDYLRNAYLSNASGTLAGDTLVSSSDISSIQLGVSRYYYSDISVRRESGLWGKGWYSSYDIKAEYNELENGSDNIIIRSGGRLSIYKQKDGVYTDAIYGLSTAERTSGGIIVNYNDGSVLSFNTDGKPVRSTDVYGNYTEFIYNDNGELTEVRSSDGDSLSFTYTEGRVSDITSSVTGDSVHYEYTDGVLAGVANTYGAVIYEYDTTSIDGRKKALTKATYSTGDHTSFEYDELGRVISVSNSEGTVSYDYGTANSIKVTDQVGNESTLYFNTSGRLKRTIDSAGTLSETEYSPLLLNTGASVGLFNRVNYEYDDKFNLTKATASDGSSVNYSYDGKGNVTRISDRGGISTAYDRDTNGSLQRLLYADGKYESFEYDAKGNITAAVKRDGGRTEYSYDSFSRPTEVHFDSGEFIIYEYDDKGNIISINENGEKTQLIYDPANMLTNIRYADGKTINYTYDAHGNMTGLRVENGSIYINYTYEYDNLSRLTGVLLDNIRFVEYSYNADGSLNKQKNYNGTYTEYGYESGRLSKITNCKSDGSVMSFFEYSYDDMGYITSVTENDGTWHYSYDKLGQLIKAKSPNGKTTVYNYDLSGNRTSVITENGTVNYNSNEMNQYTSFGSAVRSYDDNGNLVKESSEKGTALYEYDHMDRLVKVTEPDGRITEYSYDVFGNRDGVSVNGELTEYLNMPNGAGYSVASFRNGNFNAFYVQGNGLVGRLESDENGNLLYYSYSYDHLGSTAEITDEGENVVNSYSYDQEGRVVSSTEGIENPFTYGGKRGVENDNNGLYYNKSKYVSTETDSFISHTSLSENDTLNGYRYAENNPVNYIESKENVFMRSIRAVDDYFAKGDPKLHDFLASPSLEKFVELPKYQQAALGATGGMVVGLGAYAIQETAPYVIGGVKAATAYAIAQYDLIAPYLIGVAKEAIAKGALVGKEAIVKGALAAQLGIYNLTGTPYVDKNSLRLMAYLNPKFITDLGEFALGEILESIFLKDKPTILSDNLSNYPVIAVAQIGSWVLSNKQYMNFDAGVIGAGMQNLMFPNQNGLENVINTINPANYQVWLPHLWAWKSVSAQIY